MNGINCSFGFHKKHLGILYICETVLNYEKIATTKIYISDLWGNVLKIDANSLKSDMQKRFYNFHATKDMTGMIYM